MITLEKNCLVTRLRAIVQNEDVEFEFLDDGYVRFNVITSTLTESSAQYVAYKGRNYIRLLPQGNLEIMILTPGITFETILNNNNGSLSDDGIEYIYSGDAVTEGALLLILSDNIDSVSIIVKEHVDNIGFINSNNFPVNRIPNNVRTLMLNGTKLEFNLSDLSDCTKIYRLFLNNNSNLTGSINSLNIGASELREIFIVNSILVTGNFEEFAKYVKLNSNGSPAFTVMNFIGTLVEGDVEKFIKRAYNNGIHSYGSILSDQTTLWLYNGSKKFYSGISIGYGIGLNCRLNGQNLYNISDPSTAYEKCLTWQELSSNLVLVRISPTKSLGNPSIIEDSSWKEILINLNNVLI